MLFLMLKELLHKPSKIWYLLFGISYTEKHEKNQLNEVIVIEEIIFLYFI